MSLGSLLRAAASVTYAATDLTQAVASAIDLVCEFTGWPLGHLFTVGEDRRSLTSSDTWHDEDPERFAPFVEASRGLTIATGVGLPGRILASGEPAWITDVGADPNFPRAKVAAACGIGAGFGFPVVSSHGIEGILEFFACETLAPRPGLIDTISHIGLLLGTLWDRFRAEESLVASERRLHSLVELAPDAIVVVDTSGTIILVNEQAEQLTGYRRQELIGLPVETLIPLEVRAEHRAERVHYREHPHRRAMGAGKELYLLRRDGTTVPVEISLSPTEGDGRRTVVAAIRDITERKSAELAVRASEARLSEAQRIAGVGSWIWDMATGSVSSSTQLFHIFGLDPSAGLATVAEYLSRFHPDERAQAEEALRNVAKTGQPHEGQYRILLPDGTMRWIHARAERVSDVPGSRVLAGYAQDITQRKEEEAARQQAQDTLATQQRILERIARGMPLEATLDAICQEIEGRLPGGHASILLLDPNERVLRHAAAPSLPGAFQEAINGLPVAVGMGACGTAAARGTTVIVEDIMKDPLTDAFLDLAAAYGLRSVWSQPLVDAHGRVLGTFALYWSAPHRPDPVETGLVAMMGSLASLAIVRSRSEDALTIAARIDPLTGLPNRARFLERLTEALNQTGPLAVLFLDVDRFKWINDSLGHPSGDTILVNVAARLKHLESEGHVVARFGGDEFTVLVTDATAATAVSVARRIESLMTDPFVLDGGEFFLSASIGLAMNDHPADAYGLIRDADAAMYEAKESGRARHAMFDKHLRERAMGRVLLETELRRGIGRDEFVMHYQPLADFRHGRWCGVEALVRWEHPQRGLINPNEFIPLAEETGLIIPLGLKILDLVIAEAARFGTEHPPDAEGNRIYFAANVSALQLSDPSIAFDIAAMLRRHRVDPEALVLEVTESALMEQFAAARTTLERIQALGVRLVIDDFGTGYSSIARLAELPVATVKIDQRFAAHLGEGERPRRVLAAITDLAHATGLQVVTEGIETAEACADATALGSDCVQGFWLARPVPAAELPGLLARPPALGFPGSSPTPSARTA